MKLASFHICAVALDAPKLRALYVEVEHVKDRPFSPRS